MDQKNLKHLSGASIHEDACAQSRHSRSRPDWLMLLACTGSPFNRDLLQKN
jgi:hypothetical protein